MDKNSNGGGLFGNNRQNVSSAGGSFSSSSAGKLVFKAFVTTRETGVWLQRGARKCCINQFASGIPNDNTSGRVVWN